MQEKDILNKNNTKIVVGILAELMVSMGIMSTGFTKVLAQANPAMPPAGQATTSSMSNMNMSAPSTSNKTIATRDSVTVLLEGKTIPGKGFIHLYDSTPYMMKAGHVALHVPCDTNSKPNVNTLIGQAPNFKVADLENIKELSQLGNMCLYHVDSDPGKKVYLTDVAIQNPTNQSITFPPSSTIVVSINEIQPGVPGG
jgi:hypothetical protein